MLAPEEYQGACLPWERKQRAGADRGPGTRASDRPGVAAAAVIGAAVAVIRSRCYCGFVATAKGGARDRRIAASTAQKALTHLKAEGLIRTEVGLGSFVADGVS